MATTTAHDYCLRGREHYARANRQDNETAVACFRTALDLDPACAAAYVGLSLAYSQRVTALDLARTWLDEAVTAAEKAIAIDSHLPAAHRAIWTACYPRQRQRTMEDAIRKMVDLDPNDVSALRDLGWLLWFTGRAHEALPLLKRALTLDPPFRWSHFWLGNAYLALALYEDAEAMYGKAVALKPNLSSGHIGLICTYLSQGKYEQAVEQNRRFRANPDDDRYFIKAADVELLLGNAGEARVFAEKAAAAPDARYMPRGVSATTILGYILWADDRTEAQRRLDQSAALDQRRLDEGDESSMPRYDLAAVHAIRGDTGEACRWLESAIEAGWRTYRLAMHDPLLRNLHPEPRFQRMMDTLKVTAEAARQRL